LLDCVHACIISTFHGTDYELMTSCCDLCCLFYLLSFLSVIFILLGLS